MQAALCALAGLNRDDVLFAEWNSETFRPCHMLTLDRAHGALVLTIRGSLTMEDILTDVCGDVIGFEEGHAHQVRAAMTSPPRLLFFAPR